MEECRRKTLEKNTLMNISFFKLNFSNMNYSCLGFQNKSNIKSTLEFSISFLSTVVVFGMTK